MKAIEIRASLLNNIELHIGCPVDTFQNRSNEAVTNLRQYAKDVEDAPHDEKIIQKKAKIVTDSIVDKINKFHKILLHCNDVNNEAIEYIMSDEGKSILSQIEISRESKSVLRSWFDNDTVEALGGLKGIKGHIKDIYETGITKKTSMGLIGSMVMCVPNWFGLTGKSAEPVVNGSLLALELSEFANIIEDTTVALISSYAKFVQRIKEVKKNQDTTNETRLSYISNWLSTKPKKVVVRHLKNTMGVRVLTNLREYAFQEACKQVKERGQHVKEELKLKRRRRWYKYSTKCAADITDLALYIFYADADFPDNILKA